MKTIIIYYSLTGNIRFVAEKLAAELQAETLELKPKKAYIDHGFGRFLVGGRSALAKETPELEPYSVDLSDKDLIILATPVWAGTFAPPLRTFIEQNNLSGMKIALVACSSSGNTKGCFARLKELLKTPVCAELSLIDPKAKPKAENEQKIAAFVTELRSLS